MLLTCALKAYLTGDDVFMEAPSDVTKLCHAGLMATIPLKLHWGLNVVLMSIISTVFNAGLWFSLTLFCEIIFL